MKCNFVIAMLLPNQPEQDSKLAQAAPRVILPCVAGEGDREAVEGAATCRMPDVREPVAVKAERHTLRQGDNSNGGCAQIARVQDDEIASVPPRIVDIGHQPTLVFGGVG